MFPARALVLLLLLPLGLALLSAADPTPVPYLLVDGVIVLVAALDAALGAKFHVRLSREAPNVFSLGRPNRVRLRVSSTARRRLRVQLTDEVLVPGQVVGLPASRVLAAKDRVVVEYTVHPERRGAFSLGRHFVRQLSPLGLWVREKRLPAAHEVRVYPDLMNLRAFDLLARQERQYAMLRAIRRRGGESEFERLRDYTRDDEYRSIDWKATAKKQRLIAREYQLESDQSLMLLLDAGRLMTATVDGLSRLDHALNTALMLGHVASRTGDRVGLLGFDSQVRGFVEPTAGPAASRRLIRASYALHPQLVEPDFERAFAVLSARVRRRSLVVLFTHLVDDVGATRVARRVRAVAKNHLPLVVLFRDVEVERLLQPQAGELAEALYQRAAAAESMRWQEGVMTEMRRAGAHVLHVGPRALTGSVINHYLEIKARRLL